MAKESQFGYVRRDAKQLKARATMRGGGFDDFVRRDVKKYKVREGKNLIRILQPTWEGAEHYGYDLHINYSVGPDNQAYLSLSGHGRGADPLAEARTKAQRSGDEELAKQLRPSNRVGVWLIDRLAEDEGPQFWAMPQSFDKALASASTDEDSGEIIWLDDPKSGCDVRFHKEGTGLTTKYPGEKIKILSPSPLSQDAAQAAEWIDFVKENSIPEVLNFYSYDHISAVFNGASKPREDEDEAPPLKNGKTVSAKLVKAENGPAPWEDDDEDADPPARRTAPKRDEDDAGGGSIRDRLRRRRESLPAEED